MIPLILISLLKLIAYFLLSIKVNATCQFLYNSSYMLLNNYNMTMGGVELLNATNGVAILTLTNNLTSLVTNHGELSCKTPLGMLYVLGNYGYIIGSNATVLSVGVSNNVTVESVSLACWMNTTRTIMVTIGNKTTLTVTLANITGINSTTLPPILISSSSINPTILQQIMMQLIKLWSCHVMLVTRNGSSELSALLLNVYSIYSSRGLPGSVEVNVTVSGLFNMLTYSRGGGAGGLFPTSVLLTTRPVEFIGWLYSKIPLYLRFYVFDNVTRGYSLNYTLVPIAVMVKLPYQIQLFTGNVVSCKNYTAIMYFARPQPIVPIPVVVNSYGKGGFMVERYVVILSTNPDVSYLMNIEPGGIIIPSNPVSEVSYLIDVCEMSIVQPNSINDPYALLYRATIKLPRLVNTTNPINASLKLAQLLENGTIQELVDSYLNAPWGPLTASAVAMYEYRLIGVPARVVLGSMPISYIGEYLEYGYLPWVEFYYGGWVGFKPYSGLPQSSNGGLAKLLTSMGVEYVGISVLLVLPALTIYYLYLYLSSRGVYGSE